MSWWRAARNSVGEIGGTVEKCITPKTYCKMCAAPPCAGRGAGNVFTLQKTLYEYVISYISHSAVQVNFSVLT